MMKKLAIAVLCFSVTQLFALSDNSQPPVMPVTADKQAPTTPATGAPGLSPADTLASSSEDDQLFDVINKSEAPATIVDDPLQGYNRTMYKINDALDKAIAKPIARAYNAVMPEPLYGMVNNFYVNVDTVPTVGNDLLQANFYQMTADMWRIVINTTIGVGGLFDVASHMGLQKNYNDFGLTLARWGWTNSSYFIIPILGPSTIRDAGGRFVSYQMSVYPWIKDFWVRWGVYAGSLLNQRAQLLKFQDVMDQASLDPYVFMRDAYLQRRAYQIGQVNNSKNPYSGDQMKKYYDPMYLYQNG